VAAPNVPPVAQFTFSPANPETSSGVSFNGSTSSDSDGTILSFKWNFGDGYTGEGKYVTHRFNSSGTFTVTLTVTDDDGKTDSTSKPIPVQEPNKPPVARFTFSPANPDTSSGVSFNGSTSFDSGGTIRTFKWNFGDGYTGEGKYVTHRFNSAGTYMVTLTVTDDDGKTDSTSKPIPVQEPNKPPVARFTWVRSGTRVVVEARTGDQIRFDASSSYDPDDPNDPLRIVNYAWDWNSDDIYDETSNAPIAEHQFATSGEHRVTLQVTDNEGATAKVTKSFMPVDLQPPTADFSFTPTSPSILDAVQFADKSSDPDGGVTAWSWNFGDSEIAILQNPTHVYSQKGTYTVVLTVTDNDHLTATKPASITVINIPPVAQFAFSPERPAVGVGIEFDASESRDPDGEIKSYFWDFDGKGTIDAEGMVVTWSFPEEGRYTVSLTVTDKEGIEDQAEMEVPVVIPPLVQVKQTWAVVIGIRKYQDQWINDHFPVTYTEDDAQAFYDFLIDRGGGGFPEDHVHLLLGEAATLIGIQKELDWLTNMAGADDLVVFYFAGHGTYIEDKSGDEGEGDNLDECLVPYNADWSSLAATTLVDDTIGYWFSNLACQHVLMIFDSCFSGGASRGARSFGQGGSRAAAGNEVFTDMAGAGKLFLAASQEDESSYEYSDLEHGVFTYFLLRGLGDETLPEVEGLPPITEPEADEDGDGRVTVGEMQKYLDSKVSLYVKQHEGSGSQNPVVRGDGGLRGVRLNGYGVPLVGEVTAIDQELVIITLGSRHDIQPGDRFEVVHVLNLPDGQTMEEHRAVIEVVSVLGPNRSVCRVVELIYPIERRDQVRPVEK
jgi:PKD repeat protein